MSRGTLVVPVTAFRERVACERVSEFCLDANPDEPDEPSVRTRCFACGLPACKDCSIVLSRYYRWRDKRVCRDCCADHGYGRVEAENAWKRMGYEGPAPDWYAEQRGG